jgi:hypothetical protein
MADLIKETAGDGSGIYLLQAAEEEEPFPPLHRSPLFTRAQLMPPALRYP